MTVVSLSWEQAPALSLTLTSPETQSISLTLSGAQHFFLLKVPFSSDILLFEQRRCCVPQDGISQADPGITLMLFIQMVELLANKYLSVYDKPGTGLGNHKAYFCCL